MLKILMIMIILMMIWTTIIMMVMSDVRFTQERLFPKPSVTPPISKRFGDFTKPHTTIFP